MKGKLSIIISLIMMPVAAWPQDVVPATADDIRQFDQLVGRSRQRNTVEHPGIKPERPQQKKNMGAIISRETKRLKQEDKKRFGTWVRQQQQRDSQTRVEPNGTKNTYGTEQNTSPDLRGIIPNTETQGPTPGSETPPPPPKDRNY